MAKVSQPGRRITKDYRADNEPYIPPRGLYIGYSSAIVKEASHQRAIALAAEVSKEEDVATMVIIELRRRINNLGIHSWFQWLCGKRVNT